MNFADAVKSVFTQYAGFTGRARRSEFWWYFLFTIIVGIIIGIIDAVIKSPILGYLLDLALIVPTLAVGARRLHDTGRSGWWQLIALTGIGYIVLIVFWCLDGEPGPNSHGPSPKNALPPGGYGGYGPPQGYGPPPGGQPGGYGPPPGGQPGGYGPPPGGQPGYGPPQPGYGPPQQGYGPPQ